MTLLPQNNLILWLGCVSSEHISSSSITSRVYVRQFKIMCIVSFVSRLKYTSASRSVFEVAVSLRTTLLRMSKYFPSRHRLTAGNGRSLESRGSVRGTINTSFVQCLSACVQYYLKSLCRYKLPYIYKARKRKLLPLFLRDWSIASNSSD